MTAAEVYEWTTHGGSTDFAHLINVCESFGPYCLIGGLAVNCYVEPVYTLDAHLVVIAPRLSELSAGLQRDGYTIEPLPHSLNALPASSDLRVQFTTDNRYQAFLDRAITGEVLGARVQIACLRDVTQGKLWAYTDPARRLSKRKKDELDLIRLAAAYPELKSMYPASLLDQLP